VELTAPLAPETVAEPDEEVLSHLYLIYGGDLNLCGCGNPQAAWELIHRILTHFAEPHFVSPKLDEWIGTPGAVHFVMSALDDVLLEHGTSYWASWLTHKGKWALWAINSVGLDGLDDKLDMTGFPHYEDGGNGECTDECWRIPEVPGPQSEGT